MCARLTMHGWRKDLLKIRTPIRIHLCQGSTNRGARAKLRTRPKAAISQQEARTAGSVSGQYLANTVLFATVLFFASASGKFEQRRVRIVAFSFAAAVFIFAVVRTAMLPL